MASDKPTLTRLEHAARQRAWKVLRHSSRLDDDAFLARAAACPGAMTAGALLAEVSGAQELADALAGTEASRWREHERRHDSNGRSALELAPAVDVSGPGRVRALMLYAALRRRRPSVVIETGCFTGSDSALILLALARNAHGHLYTLDLPGYGEAGTSHAFHQSLPQGGLPPDLSPGFLVPLDLRGRWTLRLGDSRDTLPALLAQLSEPVDVFFHDSEHSYGHMMWEYTTIAPHLAPGALLASDDVAANTAFWDFCVAFGLPRIIHSTNANLGAAVWQPR
jgi:predicted O-methyltransferase YrrM